MTKPLNLLAEFVVKSAMQTDRRTFEFIFLSIYDIARNSNPRFDGSKFYQYCQNYEKEFYGRENQIFTDKYNITTFINSFIIK